MPPNYKFCGAGTDDAFSDSCKVFHDNYDAFMDTLNALQDGKEDSFSEFEDLRMA